MHVAVCCVFIQRPLHALVGFEILIGSRFIISCSLTRSLLPTLIQKNGHSVQPPFRAFSSSNDVAARALQIQQVVKSVDSQRFSNSKPITSPFIKKPPSINCLDASPCQSLAYSKTCLFLLNWALRE